VVSISIREAFSFFSNPHNLESLTPDSVHFQFLSAPPERVSPGTILEYRLRLYGVPLKWRTRIESVESPTRFVECAGQGTLREMAPYPQLSRVGCAGPVSIKLFAASSAPDTDFMAKLIDVRPDGYAHNLAEGVVRARVRDSLSDPTPITPGKTYEYAIDMWATSHVFKRGHRVRLEITSSNFPRYDRNPNTGHDFGIDRENDLRSARQTIFHAPGSASHLVLPVIPR
jgi:hypothetical protein